MKTKYIQLLLNEIQKLELKVANLKENQNASFSFFKESFNQTQEITRLLHELEFVQIEDMKIQMEKLVQFLSESKVSKPGVYENIGVVVDKVDEDKGEIHAEDDLIESKREIDKDKSASQRGLLPAMDSSSFKEASKEEVNEESLQFEEKESTISKKAAFKSNDELANKGFVKEDSPADSNIEPLIPTNKSLNDIQPVNHTVSDTKRSISLNDRFLFQRELFDNDRYAMNKMMIKLQAFKTYDECETYLKQNTSWNFKDEIVEKFLEMLKKTS